MGRGYWGTNDSSFEYPVAGYNTDKAVKVSISNYTDGDAKWSLQMWRQTGPGLPFFCREVQVHNKHKDNKARYTMQIVP